MKTSHHRLSRRAFVRSTGAGLGLLPLLSTDRRGARAQTGIKRLVLISWPNGVKAGEWWPDAARGSIDYRGDAALGVTETSFSFTGRRMIEPLEPHRPDILMFHGLRILGGSIPGAGHESLPHLFDVGGGFSLDQHVADQIATRVKTPFRVLNLGAQKRDNRRLVYRAGQSVTLEQDPYRLFDAMFASGALDPAVLERQRAARKSILDYLGRQVEGFGARLGTEDRARVEFHRESLREIERRLAVKPTGTAGAATAAPASLPSTRFDPRNTNNFHLVTRAMMDLAVMSLASDLTRVVTLALSDGDAFHLLMPFLGADFAPAPTTGGLGNDNNHHANAHAENDKHSRMQLWFVQQFAYFLSKLKEARDPGGARLLDGTAVMVINNMATGGGHGVGQMPIFVAGSGGGTFKTGRYLKYSPVQHTGLLAGLANAMDAPLKSGPAELARLR